jgi:hypothetical protein
VKVYLATFNDAAFGAASDVTPKFVSPFDPAAQWTGAMRGPAFFACANNYLIDVKFAEPERLAADTACGSAATLEWIVNEKGIAPHIPVIDKSKRKDGTLSREDFIWDKKNNVYICPAGNTLTTTGHASTEHTIRYNALLGDCRACPLKPKCCPNMPSRRILRDVNEDARDIARALVDTEAFEQSRRDRKRVEMLFAHLKRILRLGRLRLRGPRGTQFEFTLAAIAQNLRTLTS